MAHVHWQRGLATSSHNLDSAIPHNSLPNCKILDCPKLKALSDNKINVAEMMISFPDRVENIVGKGGNAGYQHFSPFPTMFSKALFFRVVKSWDCVVKGKELKKKKKKKT